MTKSYSIKVKKSAMGRERGREGGGLGGTSCLLEASCPLPRGPLSSAAQQKRHLQTWPAALASPTLGTTVSNVCRAQSVHRKQRHCRKKAMED